MDLFNKIKNKFGGFFDYADYGEGYFCFPQLEGPIGARMKFNNKEKIIWSINDYLGLASHPEVLRTDTEAMAKYGMAYPMGAKLLSGETQLHHELEDALKDFSCKESCELLNFGYQGVVSIIDALVDRKDVIIYDEDCHACIIDGTRLHIGQRFKYKHNDIADFEKQLQRAQQLIEKVDGSILVLTEGVFGMKGEQGKLKEIIALKNKYNFRLFVDDAHGFGVLGKTGKGTGEEQGVQDGIDIYFSTFAKAMAGFGAFVSGPTDIIKYLRYTIRSQVHAKSLPIVMVIGALKRLELLKTKSILRERLWRNVNMLREGLLNEGFNVGESNSAVTPVYLQGSTPESVNFTIELRENYDIFCSPIVYPAVPKGIILIRLVSSANHTPQDVYLTVKAFKEVKKKFQGQTITEMRNWRSTTSISDNNYSNQKIGNKAEREDRNGLDWLSKSA